MNTIIKLPLKISYDDLILNYKASIIQNKYLKYILKKTQKKVNILEKNIYILHTQINNKRPNIHNIKSPYI